MMLTRREALWTGVVGLVAAAAGCSSDGWVCEADAARLAELLDSDVAELGARWLEAHPEEKSREALVDGLGALPADGLGGWLEAKAKADFESGEIAVIDGWRLSRTEVRVCALVALAAEACG